MYSSYQAAQGFMLCLSWTRERELLVAWLLYKESLEHSPKQLAGYLGRRPQA
jgi:hypothetical protein